VTEGCHSGVAELGGAGEVAEQMPGDLALPELVEAGGVAGHGRFEVVADLAVEGGAFADQVAAVADDQLQGGPGFIAAGLEQGAAGDGGAVEGGQVGVIGLGAGVDGLAVLLGDEGVQDACLEAGGGEGPLDEAVIAAGTFDGHQAIAELVGGEGVPDLGDGGVEVGAVVGDGGGRQEDAAVEVGEEELGPRLGTVDADDAEVFGSDLLDAGVEHAPGLAETVDGPAWGRASAGARTGHERSLRLKMGLIPLFATVAQEGEFFDKTHIPGDAIQIDRFESRPLFLT
jgi:hypothetical protein